MEHLKTLAFLLVLWAFGYTLVQLITLFVRAVVALYTGGDATLLMLFCVAAAAFLGVVSAVVHVANWILAPSSSEAKAEAEFWEAQEKRNQEHEAASAIAEAADVLDEFKPPVVSFHFGLPSAELLARVIALGAKILCSATTVETFNVQLKMNPRLPRPRNLVNGPAASPTSIMFTRVVPSG